MRDSLWRPLMRLRHLQGISLRRFAPGMPLACRDHVLFELYDAGADSADEEPLYTSEQVPLDFDLLWDGLALSGSDEADADEQLQRLLREPCRGELRMVVKVAPLAQRQRQHQAAGLGQQRSWLSQPCCDPAYATEPGNRCPWGESGPNGGGGGCSAAGVGAPVAHPRDQTSCCLTGHEQHQAPIQLLHAGAQQQHYGQGHQDQEQWQHDGVRQAQLPTPSQQQQQWDKQAQEQQQNRIEQDARLAVVLDGDRLCVRWGPRHQQQEHEDVEAVKFVTKLEKDRLIVVQEQKKSYVRQQQQQVQQQPDEAGCTEEQQKAHQRGGAIPSGSNAGDVSNRSGFDPESGSSSSTGGAAVPVLEFTFSLGRLQRLDGRRPSDHDPQRPQTNQLVLEMQDGAYVPLPPPRPAAAAAAAEALSAPDGGAVDVEFGGDEDDDDFVDADGGSLTGSLPRSGSVARQQQFFRWILSNSSSVLTGLEDERSIGDVPAATRQQQQQQDEERRVSHRSAGPSRVNSSTSAIVSTAAAKPSPFAAAAARAAAAAAAAAPADGGAGAGAERSYDAREFAARTRRLVALHEQLREAQSCAAEARAKVEAALLSADGTARAKARVQQLELDRARAALERRWARVEEGQARLRSMRAGAATRRRELLATCTVLKEGADALLRAAGRLEEARSVLAGESGAGRWRQLHSELVARRCRLVADLGSVLRIGPAPAGELRRSVLAAKLEDSWWTPGSGALLEQEGADGEAGGGEGMRVRGERAAGGGRGSSAAPGTSLQICGLELRPDLAKRGLQGSVGWDGDSDEEQRVAAALGYVAHATERLADYLDVPLRYPLAPRASRSAVRDPAPAHQQAPAEHGSRTGWGLDALRGHAPWQSPRATAGGSGGSILGAAGSLLASGGSFTSPSQGGTGTPLAPQQGGAQQIAGGGSSGDGNRGVELPLYYEASDRTRFAYALFLLHKDIEQLLHAHGLSGSGPHHLLANLYALLTAAASGLPHAPAPPKSAAGGGPTQRPPGVIVGTNGGAGARGIWAAEQAQAIAAAAMAASGGVATASAATAVDKRDPGVQVPQPRTWDWGEVFDEMTAPSDPLKQQRQQHSSPTANGGLLPGSRGVI